MNKIMSAAEAAALVRNHATLSLEHEPSNLEVLASAQAVYNSGATVILQVKRVVQPKQLRPRNVHVPGFMVSAVVVNPDQWQTCEGEYNIALSFAVLEEMSLILDDLTAKDVRVLVLTGSGKSFCSGADLKEIAGFSPETARQFSLAGHEVFDKIENFPCPVVAAVNGYALGGGCELACACDLIYASERAKFGQPESRVGMITGWGGTYRLAERIGKHRAKELVFSARIISAAEALSLNLVNDVFPAEELWDKVLERAAAIASAAPIPIRLEKRMINRKHPEDLSRGREEAEALKACVETEDQKEGVSAFLEKRAPLFRNR